MRSRMYFDIEKYLQDNNIQTFTSGKNTSDGWINIRCPMCDDTSNHGGFCTTWDHIYYKCWKCGKHSIYKVLEKIIGKSDIKKSLLQYSTEKEVKSSETPQYQNSTIELPGNKEVVKRAKQYLTQRNFTPFVYYLNKYDLRFTKHLGDYKFRIIIPIYYNSKIVSYTSRDYTGKQDLRYKTCSKEKEIINHKSILYNIDNCKSNKIIVCEGILDAMKIGNNCCSTFGTNYTTEQVKLLTRYDKVFVLFDNEIKAQTAADNLCTDISIFGGFAENVRLKNVNDPAELEDCEITKLKALLEVL